MLEFFIKISDAVFRVISLVFSITLNILLVPFSWLYSLATKTLSGNWRIANLKDVYCIYWSLRKGIAVVSTKASTVQLPLDVKNPRLVLLLFVIAVPVLLIGALGVLMCKKVEEGGDDASSKVKKSKTSRRNRKGHSSTSEALTDRPQY